MPKSYFQFKQFTVFQDQCAMKVCTDACILGASVDVSEAKTILDIGTGTGLLTLMMAQRTAALIEAVEIDEKAYNQAIKNISETKFSKQIQIFREDIKLFKPNKNYDLIVSNPPFYQHSLHSPDLQTNKALHALTLTFQELATVVQQLLNPNGKFTVLLPPFETQQLTEIAKSFGLFLSAQTFIQHNETKPVFRVIASFRKQATMNLQTDTLMIHQKDSSAYSQAFQELMKDYYIIF